MKKSTGALVGEELVFVARHLVDGRTARTIACFICGKLRGVNQIDAIVKLTDNIKIIKSYFGDRAKRLIVKKAEHDMHIIRFSVCYQCMPIIQHLRQIITGNCGTITQAIVTQAFLDGVAV